MKTNHLTYHHVLLHVSLVETHCGFLSYLCLLWGFEYLYAFTFSWYISKFNGTPEFFVYRAFIANTEI